MSKRPYHHGNLREALVDAAMLEVRERGVAGLTLRGVARRAGVSQAAPYHHFPSKEALVAELCLRGFRLLNQRLRDAQATTDEPEPQLRAMCEAYVAFAREHPDRFRVLFGQFIAEKQEYGDLVQETQASFEILVHAIARGQTLGVFCGDDPIRASLGVWAAVHGASLIVVEGTADYDNIRQFGIDSEKLVEATLDNCLRGLRA